MKQFLQTSKSSVSDAIKAVGLKDMARTAASAAANAAIQSVFSSPPTQQQQPVFQIQPRPLRQQLQQQQQLPQPLPEFSPNSTPPPPLPLPAYYPPYYYPSPPPVPREPFYPQTVVAASRVDTIVPGKVAEADLHHVGKHPYPFYKQKWFIVLIIVIVVAIIIGIVIGVILYVRHKDNTDPNVTFPAVPNY